MAGRPRKDGVKAPEKESKVEPKETKEEVNIPVKSEVETPPEKVIPKVEPKKEEEVSKKQPKKDIPRKECGNSSCPYGYGSSYCKSCIDYIRS